MLASRSRRECVRTSRSAVSVSSGCLSLSIRRRCSGSSSGVVTLDGLPQDLGSLRRRVDDKETGRPISGCEASAPDPPVGNLGLGHACTSPRVCILRGFRPIMSCITPLTVLVVFAVRAEMRKSSGLRHRAQVSDDLESYTVRGPGSFPNGCDCFGRGHSIQPCEEVVKAVGDIACGGDTVENLTRAKSMAQPGATTSGGGGQDGWEEYATAVAASSSGCSGHEASEYVSASMDEVEILAAIEKSRKQGWSEVADHVRERAAGAWSGGLSEADQLLWEKLKEEGRGRFRDWGEEVKLGRVIAVGGQAHIYEASIDGLGEDYVAKVFKMEGFSLADLHRQWPRATKDHPEGYFKSGEIVIDRWMSRCNSIILGTFLKDGRFAFFSMKYWGDLRRLINLRLKDNNDHGPPFSNNEVFPIMDQIARGMEELHGMGVLHRDLKAANVLVESYGTPLRRRRTDYFGDWLDVKVADYESSVLVQGTGFWRAPEVLEDLMKKSCERNKEIWTEKVDVYGYAMTCYEVLTGHTPFEGYVKSDWKRVIDGERPHLPDDVDFVLGELVKKCWHNVPSERPSFKTIRKVLQGVYWRFQF